MAGKFNGTGNRRENGKMGWYLGQSGASLGGFQQEQGRETNKRDRGHGGLISASTLRNQRPKPTIPRNLRLDGNRLRGAKPYLQLAWNNYQHERALILVRSERSEDLNTWLHHVERHASRIILVLTSITPPWTTVVFRFGTDGGAGGDQSVWIWVRRSQGSTGATRCAVFLYALIVQTTL